MDLQLERLVWDDAALAEFLTGVRGIVADWTAGEVQDWAEHVVPVRTGRLKASISSGTEHDGDGVFGWAGSRYTGRFLEPSLGRHSKQMLHEHPFLPSALFMAVDGQSWMVADMRPGPSWWML